MDYGTVLKLLLVPYGQLHCMSEAANILALDCIPRLCYWYMVHQWHTPSERGISLVRHPRQNRDNETTNGYSVFPPQQPSLPLTCILLVQWMLWAAAALFAVMFCLPVLSMDSNSRRDSKLLGLTNVKRNASFVSNPLNSFLQNQLSESTHNISSYLFASNLFQTALNPQWYLVESRHCKC